jgi:hypothetical protein
MWMVDPRLVCSKHLLGEHVELHMFVGCLLKRKRSHTVERRRMRRNDPQLRIGVPTSMRNILCATG